MPQEIKIPLDFQDVGKIVNLPDGVEQQDAATVHQLDDLEATIGGTLSGAGKYLIAGGAVWSGTGLTYNVSSISYFWNGDKVADPTSVTLLASDPTNDRLDAVVVSEAGVISVITGDPSPNPITPAIPEDQLLVQYLLVEAGTTVPAVTQENVYLDNAEWTASNYTTSGTQVGTSNFNATDSPKQGSKCIDNSLDPRTGIRFSRATSLDITPYTTLEVWVRYPVAMASAENLYVQFENTSFAAIGTRVDLFNYGLQKNVVNTWQLALVPLSAFGVTTVQGFRMILSGGKNNVLIEWDVDFISILNGSAPIVTSPTINFYENSIRVASQKGLDMIPGTGMGITAVEDPVKETVKYTFTPDTNKAYVDAADAALLSDIEAKEDAITPGTVSQYLRGDKTWQAFDSAVLASTLAGLSITGGAVTSDDNVLSAFGKLQNQINGILGGATYQGVWNASTNSPALTSGVGTKGYYYVVSVDGSTNLDGITDWKVGDWAIFNGTTWDKVDNTDAVSSVNGAIGAISLAGTANRISVTGTTFDIASTYAGQASINTVGTVTTGVWQGTPVASGYGGTGFSTYAAGDIIYASAANTLAKLAATTDTYVLTLSGGLPVWAAASGGGGGSVGGSNTQVQFNDSGVFGGSSSFTYDKTNKKLTLSGYGANAALSFGATAGFPAWFLYDGGAGNRAGMGFNTNEFQTFTSSANTIRWSSGGDFQTVGTNSKMALVMSSGNLTIAGAFSCNGITNPGTNEGTSFKCIWTAPRKLIYYYDGGTTSYGVGINSNEIQTYGPSTGFYTWNNAGDFKATGTNEVMRLHLGTGSLLLGTTSALASSILTLASTTKGFLSPRMTTTQRTAIASPAEGLEVYDTTLHKKCVYTGGAWETITSS